MCRCVFQTWAGTFHGGPVREDWLLLDRPARSWRLDRRCGLRLTYTRWDKEQPGTVQTNSGKHSGRRRILETSACLSPDSGDGSCVAMAADKIGGFWDDKQCSEKFFFFCEKSRPDITPPTKAPTPPPSQGCTAGWTALPHFRNCYKVTIAEWKRPCELSSAELLGRMVAEEELGSS